MGFFCNFGQKCPYSGAQKWDFKRPYPKPKTTFSRQWIPKTSTKMTLCGPKWPSMTPNGPSGPITVLLIQNTCLYAARGSSRQFFPQNFCQNSEYFWEFLPKFCVKFYPKKRVITTITTKNRVNATFATKKMLNCSINRFTTQIFASVKGKAWFFD